MVEQWVVMAVKNRGGGRMREDVAALSLARMGYEAWAPIVTRWVRRRVGPLRQRVIEQVRAPWFTGYVFVDVASGEGWAGLAEHLLIGEPIRFGPHPVVLSTRVMAGLREDLARWDAGEVARESEPIRIGDQVRVELGALAGCAARVEATSDAMVRLELPMCGGALVWVPAEDCARVAAE